MPDKDLNSTENEPNDIFETFIDMKLSTGDFGNDSDDEENDDIFDYGEDDYDGYDYDGYDEDGYDED